MIIYVFKDFYKAASVRNPVVDMVGKSQPVYDVS